MWVKPVAPCKCRKLLRISREEAEDILKRAKEPDCVHQLSNIDGPDFSLLILPFRKVLSFSHRVQKAFLGLRAAN